jgi:predicted O-linked N-acetylglucosamine transferase (SPINDLY family)
LPVFALKPAPIQISYLGYPNTTGLPTMDYRLTDELADPPGLTERYHTEQLVRLPHGFLCYTPPADAPPPGDSPVETAGHVTFGSFNSIAKVTPQVIDLWSSILSALPSSRLILKSHALTDAGVRERFTRLFSGRGVEPGRVELLGYIRGRSEHLSLYQRIDIGLDSFPYNGTTTTCEALWMGVPVITLSGETHAGRVGMSILSHAGLPELVTENEDDYRDLALELARNPARVKDFRHCLRQRLRESPLCQGQSFARDAEQAYRQMWRGWCNTHNLDGRLR